MKYVTTAALLLLMFLLPGFVTAKSPESYGISSQRTLPGSSFYPLKRLKEKIKAKIIFSSEKRVKYRALLLEKRVSELISVIDIKDVNHIPDASQRFAYEAGVLAELVYKDINLKSIPLNNFLKYQPILAELRDNYGANSAYWLYIQQDIDTLNILGDKLK